MKKIIFWIH